MTRIVTSLVVATVTLTSSFLTQSDATACTWRVYRTTVWEGNGAYPTQAAAYSSSTAVVCKPVQSTPQYDLRRPEVPSGARLTLMVNFLGKEEGCVVLNVEGTASECKVVEWKPNSVTAELPRLSLLEPKNAEIQVIMPDGRIAKSFPILLINQPGIVVHGESVPQPMPPAPATTPASYAGSR